MPDTVPGVGVHWGHKVWKGLATGSPHQISHPHGATSSKMALIPEPRWQYHSSPRLLRQNVWSLNLHLVQITPLEFSDASPSRHMWQAVPKHSSALEFLLPSSHLNTSLLTRTSNRCGSESVCLSGAATSEHKGAKKSPSS